MRWFRRATALLPQTDELDDDCGQALLYLQEALERAEEGGATFRPQTRLARKALRAIHWR